MNINFDTNSIGQEEVRGLIALLSALIPGVNLQITGVSSQPAPSPTPTPSTPQSDPPPAPGPTLVQPEPTTTRKRRTKAEMEAAAQDAPADPSQGSDAAAAAASGTTQPVTASSATASAGEVTKPISADELRALLNGYIKKHTMEAAIAILKEFGCNRVTEALALEPTKLNELASKLNG